MVYAEKLYYFWVIDMKPNHRQDSILKKYSIQFSSVQSLSHVQLPATPWIAARQASLSIINSHSLLKLMSIALVMPSNHLFLCCALLLPLSIFPSIRIFSSELALPIRGPKYWSFSISPSNEYSNLVWSWSPRDSQESSCLLPWFKNLQWPKNMSFQPRQE